MDHTIAAVADTTTDLRIKRTLHSAYALNWLPPLVLCSKKPNAHRLVNGHKPRSDMVNARFQRAPQRRVNAGPLRTLAGSCGDVRRATKDFSHRAEGGRRPR